MTIIDRGCWERGCACYDSRVADETVDVVEKREWVNLTSEEIGEIYRVGWAANMELARAIEAKLREKNERTI
jgi:hypothetical protein